MKYSAEIKTRQTGTLPSMVNETLGKTTKHGNQGVAEC